MVSVLAGFGQQQLLEGLGKAQSFLLMAGSSDPPSQKREVAGGGGVVNTAFKGQGPDFGFFLLSEPYRVHITPGVYGP